MLPACLSAVIGATYLCKRLIDLELVQKNCIEHGIKMQSDIAKNINSLLLLNPKATQLRLQRQVAEKRLLAAVASQQPAAIAFASAHLRVIILQQVAFKAKQDAQKYAATTHETAWRYKIFLDKNLSRVTSTPMAVIAIPESSLTPDYFLKENFKWAQRASVKWKLHEHKGQCTASLDKSLVPTITESTGG